MKIFVAVALVMGLGTSVAFAENFHASVDSVNIVNEFKPIEVKDLPQAVLDAVTKDYAEFYHQRSIRRRSGRNKNLQSSSDGRRRQHNRRVIH